MSLFDPADGDPVTIRLESDDPTCTVCGAALSYSGRGRKPTKCEEHKGSRSTGTGTRGGKNKVSDAELNAACSNLNTLYESLVMPLMFASPKAAGIWAEQIDPLNARNRVFLANNKTLVTKINSTGEKGGTVGFVVAHIAAITPVVLALTMDSTVKRNERTMAKRQQEGWPTSPSSAGMTDAEWAATVRPDDDDIVGTPFDPDAVFRK